MILLTLAKVIICRKNKKAAGNRKQLLLCQYQRYSSLSKIELQFSTTHESFEPKSILTDAKLQLLNYLRLLMPS
jgi:hypothetical protein